MKSWLLTVTAAGLAGCAALAPHGPKAEPLPNVAIPYEKHILPNGLTVILHEDHKAPIVALQIWYHVGSKDERPGRSGFAHLFEHLMFQGSEHHRDEYFKPLEDAGATDVNGNTWLDRTVLYETVPSTALDLALWMESDRMAHLLPAIDQKLLDEQRGVVQNEKRQDENQPYGRVWELLQRASFPEGHPYHWTTIGSMKDLNAASLDDVKDWFREYYGAANATLVLAGDIEPKAAYEKVQQYFGVAPPGPPVARRTQWIAPRTEATREVLDDRVAQPRIYKTWNAPGTRDPQIEALQLAAYVIGGAKTSRLYRRLVEGDRLADQVSASVIDFELASLFEIDADMKHGADPAKVEAAIGEELARFLIAGPSADELARAKTAIAAGFARSAERVGGSGGKAAILAEGEVYHGDPGVYRAALARLAAATPKDVRAAARQWLARGDYTLTVKPFANYSPAPEAVDRSHGPPAVERFPDLSFPALQRARLANGIPVVLAERHGVPEVLVSFQFDAGYAADPSEQPGLASLALGMLDEGTTSLSSQRIAEREDALGADISAGSSLDVSTVSLGALTTRLDESLALFADIVRHPAFDAKEFARVQGQALAQIAQEKTSPVSLALRLLPPLLYGEGHTYAKPLTGSGTEASVRAATPQSLRDFYRRWIRPDNGVLLVAGDTTLAAILPKLNAAFGDWRAPVEPPPQKAIAPVPLPPGPRVYLMDRPGAQQSVILAGEVAPSSKAPNHLEIQTMNEVLGGTFTSRLNMELREARHWSYGAFSVLPGAVGQRPFLLYAPVQTDKTAQSVAEMLRQVRVFIGETPATAAEIARNKAADVRSLPGEFESDHAVLGTLQRMLLYRRPDDYVQTLKRRIEAQKDDDVRAAARAVVHPDALTWLVVGDLAKIEQPIRTLGIAPVQVLDEEGRVIR